MPSPALILNEAARAIRSRWRRAFSPRGPNWFSYRLSSVVLIMGLYGCDRAEALRRQAALDASRLAVWLEGY